MSRRTKKPNVSEKPAGDQIYAFAACGNFPKEHAGLNALAEALEKAAQITGITMRAIVEECLSSSSWCPTPFDLRQVAVSIRDKIRSAREGSRHAEWRRIYGDPQPDWAAKMVKLAMERGGHADEKLAIHQQAIRDMLYYTEGEGRLLGDREFWEEARRLDLRDWGPTVERIREQGGWRSERELQGAS